MNLSTPSPRSGLAGLYRFGRPDPEVKPLVRSIDLRDAADIDQFRCARGLPFLGRDRPCQQRSDREYTKHWYVEKLIN